MILLKKVVSFDRVHTGQLSQRGVVFEDQSTTYTETTLQATIDGAKAIVPAIWRLEIANALVVAERRKLITPQKTAQFISALGKFSISVEIDGLDQVWGSVLEIACSHQRSVYDASYLELAYRLNLPLATKDAPMVAAAESLGIRRFEP